MCTQETNQRWYDMLIRIQQRLQNIIGNLIYTRFIPDNLEAWEMPNNLYGYISLPEVTRSNRNHMTTIVNGRVVKNSTLYKTINDSYSNFKEDSRYPVCILMKMMIKQS